MIFRQCQRAWGLPSGEVQGSQWGGRDVGPIMTLNTERRRRQKEIHVSTKTFQSPLVAGSFLAWCPPALYFALVTKVKQVLEQIHGSRIQPAPRLNTHSWAACYAQHFAG